MTQRHEQPVTDGQLNVNNDAESERPTVEDFDTALGH